MSGAPAAGGHASGHGHASARVWAWSIGSGLIVTILLYTLYAYLDSSVHTGKWGGYVFSTVIILGLLLPLLMWILLSMLSAIVPSFAHAAETHEETKERVLKEKVAHEEYLAKLHDLEEAKKTREKTAGRDGAGGTEHAAEDGSGELKKVGHAPKSPRVAISGISEDVKDAPRISSDSSTPVSFTIEDSS